VLSCTPKAVPSETNCPCCSEEKIWELIFDYRPFVKPILRNKAIVIDNAFSTNTRLPAYSDYFECGFYDNVIDAWSEDILNIKNPSASWEYGQEMSKIRNKRFPIGATHVADNYPDIYFLDLNKYSQFNLPEPFSVRYKARCFYPFGKGITYIDGGKKAMVGLDAGDEFVYHFHISTDSCKVTFFDQILLDNYHCDRIDWVDYIDFDMSLDSFYETQYYDLLRRLDSIEISKNPNSRSLYKDIPALKGKW